MTLRPFPRASATHRRRINRYEAVALLVTYLVYMALRTTKGLL